jgi:hypothetical protein
VLPTVSRLMRTFYPVTDKKKKSTKGMSKVWKEKGGGGIIGVADDGEGDSDNNE